VPKGFQPGHAKVGGRSIGSAAREVIELAREHTPEAIETLVAIMRSDDEDRALAAANALLDRGWGRPHQSLAVEAHVESASVVLDYSKLTSREWDDYPALYLADRSGNASPEQARRFAELRSKMLSAGTEHGGSTGGSR
jgi:hypothetical protein